MTGKTKQYSAAMVFGVLALAVNAGYGQSTVDEQKAGAADQRGAYYEEPAKAIAGLKHIPGELLNTDHPVIVNELARTGGPEKGSVRFAPNGVYLKVGGKDKFGAHWGLIDIKKKDGTLVLTLEHFEDVFGGVDKYAVLVCDIADLYPIKIGYIEYPSAIFR